MTGKLLGHADVKDSQIFAHYAPSPRELEIVNKVFGGLAATPDAAVRVERRRE